MVYLKMLLVSHYRLLYDNLKMTLMQRPCPTTKYKSRHQLGATEENNLKHRQDILHLRFSERRMRNVLCSSDCQMFRKSISLLSSETKSKLQVIYSSKTFGSPELQGVTIQKYELVSPGQYLYLPCWMVNTLCSMYCQRVRGYSRRWKPWLGWGQECIDVTGITCRSREYHRAEGFK